MKKYFTFEKRGKIWTARIKEFDGIAFGRTKREAMAEYMRLMYKSNYYWENNNFYCEDSRFDIYLKKIQRQCIIL